MESWSCVSGGKGLVADDVMSPSSSIGGGRIKNAPVGWDLSAPALGFDHDMTVSAQSIVHADDGLGEIGFQEVTTRQFQGCSRGNFTSNAPFYGVNGSSSSLVHPALPADCRDSLLIDLKLGRFLPDITDSHNPKVPQGIPIFSSSQSSLPQKRVRSGGLSLQVAYCQVYGCYKDLSSCKDYHKRHKVCEVHSKTPRVIVNGIEQRFCQQCSRFHLLAEFDESKRSCRKRLAGHNERRRKPQVSIQAGRIGRLLQPYSGPAGNVFRPSSSRASSLIRPDIIFNGNLLNPDRGGSNMSGCIKVEDRDVLGPPSAVPLLKGHLDSKSPYSYERPFNFFHDGESSIGAEDFTIFGTASTIQALSGISECGCALSLLSSQSQSSSSHSFGIPMAQPLIPTGMDYDQQTSHTSFRGLLDKASFMKPGERGSASSLLIPDPVNFEFPDGALQGPEFSNVKDGSTINLLQLSSQLQRVEDQRQFI
ncbi:hypothetical protein MLD38_032801 [Melastoma candidum]|uniref:Uncharacterized protein n=1 Tax=Melastoma candidum TaxID=119954 RepID=A0ACB9M4G7_9MYRT|nr:hypothetical protein MLD38_032801 [Melastoma candidum]